LPRYLYALELLQDFENASSRPSRVVVQLVNVLGVYEFEQALSMELVVGEMGELSKKRPARDGHDVEVVGEQYPQGDRLIR
jgi:hypothetical protein